MPWIVPVGDGLAVSVVLRSRYPRDSEDLVWIAASLAVVHALVPLGARDVRSLWPDTVVSGPRDEVCGPSAGGAPTRPDVARDVLGARGGSVTPAGTVMVARGFGPLVAEWLTATLRVRAPRAEPEQLLENLLRAFTASLATLAESPAALLHDYAASSETLGRRVTATLLPQGEARGTAREVDGAGRLVLVSETGMIERVGVEELDRVSW